MRFPAIVLAALAVVTTGCQQTARLDWTAPPLASNLQPVYYEDLARDCRNSNKGSHGDMIGKHRVSLLDVAVSSIHADASTPVQSSFDRAIRDALGAAGYDPRPASEAPAGSPIIRGEIRQCYFGSSMPVPMVITQGGQVEVALQVKSPEGDVVWQRKFQGDAKNWRFGSSTGFDEMAMAAMTEVVADVAKACSSSEFRTAVVR